MKPLYIIPARGGSKGIPRKNIKPLGGRPLIAWTIDTALALAPSPDHILLSTDDDEIAAVARELGIDVPYMRPPELATDTAGSREMMLHALDWADSQAIDYDCVVLLQPTSPLRRVEDVEECLRMFEARPEADMVVTVAEAVDNPYYNIFEPAEDGTLHISKGDGRLTRRQDAPPAYVYNGAVYVMRPASLRRYPLGEMPRRLPVVMPRSRSIDLDTPLDWEIAETIMARQTL